LESNRKFCAIFRRQARNQLVLAGFSERKMAEHFAAVVHEGKITPFDKYRLMVRSTVPEPQF
jgi:hypothetical protein